MPPKSKRNKQQREATAAAASGAPGGNTEGVAVSVSAVERLAQGPGNSRGGAPPQKKKETGGARNNNGKNNDNGENPKSGSSRRNNNNNNNRNNYNNNGNNRNNANGGRNNNGGRGSNNNGYGNNNNNNNSNNNNDPTYLPYWSSEDCLQRYSQKDPTVAVVRGKLRVLPTRDGAAFVTCDRGLYKADVCLTGPSERNRALDGDIVYVELLPEEGSGSEDAADSKPSAALSSSSSAADAVLSDDMDKLALSKGDEDEAGDTIVHQETSNNENETWQDDALQMDLWNPVVPVPRRQARKAGAGANANATVGASSTTPGPSGQRKGRVVFVIPPKSVASELPGSNSNNNNNNNQKTAPPARRRIVGSLKVMKSGTCLLTPNNKSLPQFKCPADTHQRVTSDTDPDKDRTVYSAEYEYLSWGETHKWPPCIRVQKMGKSCVVEDEIQALLTENELDHGDFDGAVLKDVHQAIESGVYLSDKKANDSDSKTAAAAATEDWKPTPEMYKGRRDYRSERIFTIDPTTAKDLDDALHVKQLPDGRVEIGVHIADVSFFIQPGTAVDQEAQKRATTVYLVDRTVPMLPRPLCEVACSLNENVERLAFSCVWTMNMDGTLKKKGDKVSEDDVWYGRTVIKSCARLDYSTAQNIIDKKVAHGESESELDEKDWPKSRRPTGGHTIDEVAFDVRLMHVVAMARRKLRFDNGALALHGIKLSFQLDSDGQTPLLASPYPIRDSNKLIEEYMLLANYLVAQRLISHAKGKALLRQHPEPLDDGLDKVVEVAKASINFDIDASTSATLHASLHRLSRECDDPLVLQSITQMLMTPMQPADYFAAGQVEPMLWRHFALNIPYYTHFTSPIRRYPDVIVHRLLQATLDGDQAVENFTQDSAEINQICIHCNEMRMKSKTAQERCDRVFLSLYVLKNPMKSELGVVMSVGVKTFNVYVPSLGISTMLFLDEHVDELTSQYVEEQDGARGITLHQKAGREGIQWGTLDIKVFTKLLVTVFCKDKPPIDVGLKLEGPWSG